MKFDISSYTLIASLIWGSIGFGFATFGWKQKDPLPLIGGIALMAISYFIWSAIPMSLVGTALVALIIFLKRRS